MWRIAPVEWNNQKHIMREVRRVGDWRLSYCDILILYPRLASHLEKLIRLDGYRVSSVIAAQMMRGTSVEASKFPLFHEPV